MTNTEHFRNWIQTSWPLDNDLYTDLRRLKEEATEASETFDSPSASYEDLREDLVLELVDTLHFIDRIAARIGYSLEDVMNINIEKLTNRKKYGKHNHGSRS